MKTFQQARGSNSLVTMGFESALATAATSGVGLKFNNMTLTRNRDLNSSGTIQSGRSPVEPFQGNGDVNGEITVPNDLNQLFYFLKAAFGAPATTSDGVLEKSIDTIIEATTGYVQMNVGENHGFNQGDVVTVSGVTEYNGTYTVANVMTQAIIIAHAYVVPSSLTNAKVTRSGKYTHVFRIGNEQPSVTIEKLFGDIAEKEVYLGCKVSSMEFRADASGQENTVTCGFVGCKPQAITNAIAISSIAVSSGTATVTTTTAHGLSAGDIFVIAGSGKQILDGKHSVVAAATTTTLTFTTTAADGTNTYSTSAEQPALLKSQFTTITSVPLSRLGAFSASVKKDNVTYNCAKEFNVSFNMGIDTDQRCIGDNGYLSSLPEGTVEISTSITALFRSAELQKIAANNDTVAWILKYESSAGSLTIELPENKVQEAGVPIESAMGLSQSLTMQAFCSTAESGDSAAIITLVNDVAA